MSCVELREGQTQDKPHKVLENGCELGLTSDLNPDESQLDPFGSKKLKSEEHIALWTCQLLMW